VRAGRGRRCAAGEMRDVGVISARALSRQRQPPHRSQNGRLRSAPQRTADVCSPASSLQPGPMRTRGPRSVHGRRHTGTPHPPIGPRTSRPQHRARCTAPCGPEVRGPCACWFSACCGAVRAFADVIRARCLRLRLQDLVHECEIVADRGVREAPEEEMLPRRTVRS
jgi:hypothetical protein